MRRAEKNIEEDKKDDKEVEHEVEMMEDHTDNRMDNEQEATKGESRDSKNYQAVDSQRMGGSNNPLTADHGGRGGVISKMGKGKENMPPKGVERSNLEGRKMGRGEAGMGKDLVVYESPPPPTINDVLT